MPGDSDLGAVPLGHFDGKLHQVPGVIQLLVHFQQGHLGIGEQSVAELVGIELGAGMGYDVISGVQVLVEGSAVTR